MPEIPIPKEAWAAVDGRLDELPQPERRTERDRWRMISREAVHAAAPALAEAIAQAILAHMDEHMPLARLAQDPAPELRAYRRHFGIAAQVAAFAFTTDDDRKRLAAEALARGDFVVCAVPEPQEQGESVGNGD